VIIHMQETPSTHEALAARGKTAPPKRASTACCSTRIVLVFAAFGAVVAATPSLVGRTIWWAGYDLRNCPGCEQKIDWMAEKAKRADGHRARFRRDGVVVLRDVLNHSKVADLASACDGISNTFMTDVIARFILAFYLRYEHRLDTRDEHLRDWAVHGPLGKWAAELLGVKAVRLYNAEMIFHKGDESPTCRAAWHRDTLAAPFAPGPRAVTFNVYLEGITAEGDGLIYQRGSHRQLDAPQRRPTILKPTVRVGDVLAHDPNTYHTTSGVGCWRRRSLQFRYVEDGVTFAHGPHRLPHGPIPWTLAHAPGIAPHGLVDGDALTGPWYPLVHPAPLPAEHVPAPGAAWSLARLLALAGEAEELGHGNGTDVPPEGFLAFDGPVKRPEDWAFVELPDAPIKFLYHKRGEGYKAAMA